MLSSLLGPGTPVALVGLGVHVAVSCHLGVQSAIPTAGPRLRTEPPWARAGPKLKEA